MWFDIRVKKIEYLKCETAIKQFMVYNNKIKGELTWQKELLLLIKTDALPAAYVLMLVPSLQHPFTVAAMQR